MKNRSSRWRLVLWLSGVALFFALYTSGLSHNPPGFYVDESGIAYNAYLVAHTGAGEFGPRFPLFFQFFTNGFTAYVSPTQIYLLSVVFFLFPPGILLARILSAFWVFAACLLVGLLAKRISGQLKIGVIVAATALLTPWLFEVRGLLLEPHFVPMALSVFLLVVHRVQGKETWNVPDIAMLAASLALLTYCYTSGRLLGPLLALGLLFFSTTRRRLVGIIKTWLLYGLTLFPILVFNWRHPGALTRRLNEVSYIRPGVPWSHIAPQFVKRYLEDQSLTGLLLTGDALPRHHVPGSGGAMFFATFVLAMMGLLLVIALRRRDPWWRFVIYGLAVSIVPGAITVYPFHAMRLMACPVFLLVLTVPALEWLLGPGKHKSGLAPPESNEKSELLSEYGEGLRTAVAESGRPSRSIRLGTLVFLLALTVVEATNFQSVFRREGPKRQFEFDVPYKAAYDAATAQPARPIYLEDGFWGPAYIHAFWYATVEKRPTSEFVHLAAGSKPPPGAVVISSEQSCQNCEIIKRSGVYLVYKSE